MRSWGLLVALIAACGGNGDNCATGQMSCDGTCVDPSNSHDNCGSCGHACSATEVCGNGTCGDACPANQMLCDGICADTTSDAMNCGGCGMACTGGDVCVDSECQVPCDPSMLMSEITDPWGTQWDGLERGPLALDAARAACLAFGARLPTPTEMFRVSATQSGAVGQAFNTAPLWSAAPDDKLDQATLRLSDGIATSTPATTATKFRCVCAAPAPKTFTGNHCNGTAGSECFALDNFNIDAKDRPALRKGAAVWECTNEHAHVLDSRMLLEAIHAGLPGANVALATADQANYYSSVGIKWTTSTWTPTGNLSIEDIRTPSPFRCAGLNALQSPNPNTIANQFVGPQSPYKGETADNAPAAWAAAHDTCFVRGGHLPTAAELAELIQQGLPNGTGDGLWTSDEVGYNGTQFLAEVLNWTALDQRFSYFYAGADATATHQYKTTASGPYRCIYYPIDAAYVPPTTCHGGCFMASLGGSPSPVMWLDSTDRPNATVYDAIAACADEHGHLASERDLTEAIRAGLPNGSNANISTSDFGFSYSTSLNYYGQILNWTAIETAFTDQYAAYSTWGPPATARGYRCVWTNEIR